MTSRWGFMKASIVRNAIILSCNVSSHNNDNSNNGSISNYSDDDDDDDIPGMLKNNFKYFRPKTTENQSLDKFLSFVFSTELETF